MKRLALILVLVLALAVPTFAQEPLEIGVTEEGTLKEGMQSYTFSAAAQQVFVFGLESEDFDPFLQVESADGDVLVSDDDSGEGLNSRIVFVAPEVGEYSVVVRSYSGDASGAYVLTSTDEVDQLAYDQREEITLPAGGTIQTFFIGEKGDVINLSATATESGVDTRLTLTGPDGLEVASNDDYNGTNPMLNRFMLPETGMYTVLITPYGDDDSGEMTVLLEKTTLPMLTREPYVVKFSEDSNRDVVGVEVAADTLYEISIVASKLTSGSLTIDDNNAETYSDSNFSFYYAEGASILYRSEESGIIRLSIRNDGYELPVEFSITATPVE